MYKISIFLIIAILFNGCSEEKKQEVVVKPVPLKVVKVLDIQTQESKAVYEYPAKIYAAQDTTMAFEVSGKIVAFNYNEGQKIKKGSVIASLDDTIYRANFNSAKANYKQAKIDFERYAKLYKSRSIAKADMEKMQQQLDVTKSALQVAKKNLSETKLIAEFDGVLAKKIINDYERVTAKQPIVILQDTSYYKVKFFAPEHDVMKIKGGLSAKNISKQAKFYVTIGNGVKKTFQAYFNDISTTAEAVTRTFETTLKMKKPKNSVILPGMSAEVRVIQKRKAEIYYFIPAQAIFSDKDNQAFVWSVDKDMRVHKKAVVLGGMQENKIRVISGLENIDRIVLSGIRFLKEDEQITQYKKIGE